MNSKKKSINEEQLDLVQMFQFGWKQRRIIFLFILIFGILSVILALLSPKEFTVITKLVPSSNEGSSIGFNGIGSLASLAGINLGSVGASGGNIPLNLYPEIIKSIPFKTDLLDTKITSSRTSETISFKEYKQNYSQKTTLSILRKYTLGLPGIIKKAISKDEYLLQDGSCSDSLKKKILTFSYDEMNMLNSLEGQIQLEVNEREGIIVLSSKMPEPFMAAQMAERALQLLRQKVTEFRVKKAKEQFIFTKKLYSEKKSSFEQKQTELALFRDRNRNISLSVIRNEQERLESEYDLALNVYNEVAKQLETSKIKMKEITPSFSILEPVVVPIEPSKPKRKLMVFIGVSLGFIFGVGWITLKDLYANFINRFNELNRSSKNQNL